MQKNISVETQNLTRKFGKFIAVNQVSITVYQGEIFGFLGANGAGKTTMIRMLCGLLKPSEGTGSVAGFDIMKENEKIKTKIGYMSQKFSLYEDLTVAENIDFYGGIYGLSKNEIKTRKQELVDQIGLSPYVDKLTKDLPLGIRQRLALGSAMLHDPPILFLDEPTSGVDPKARREFWNLLYETVKLGKTIFVTTHYMDEAEYCHRVSIMQQGEIIALDTPGAMKQKYQKETMQDVFVALVEQ
jgi:ABC-2 type transport system ATP-binding protein